MSAFDPLHEVKIPFAGKALHTAVVPDQDIHHFGISHPKHVDLVATPLASHDDIHHGHGHTHPGVEHPDSSSSSAHTPTEKHQPLSDDEPVLKRPHEAPTIQLFFDLYFVANLTTFSGQHEIHDWNALRSYIGYFTMIWFTWFQNTMFDVRFSNDSALERCFKAAQFGIMTGFAITGPGYQTGFQIGTGDAFLALNAFQTLSLILMTSRLILCLQYGVALVWLRGYKKAVIPLCAHIAVLFCTSMIYLGLYFAFHQSGTEKVLAGWYVTFVVEAWLVLVISGAEKFKWMSFRNTVLVERLGLLTLIILGEGIISMSNALNNSNADNFYDAQIIGQIICCVVVAYLIYMLYFDNVQPERMGSKRQHIWAVLHFPFHCSIVLVVEALAQFAIWTKVVAFTQPLLQAVQAIDPDHPTSDQVARLQATWNDVAGHFNLSTSEKTVASYITLPDLSQDFNTLMGFANGTLKTFLARQESASQMNGTTTNSTSPAEGSGESEGTDLNTVMGAANDIYNQGIQYVCNKFRLDIDAPSDENGNLSQAQQIFGMFQVVYIYFFCFAGLVLVVLSILFLIGKRHKLRGELIGASLRFLAGIALMCLAAISSGGIPDANETDALHNYMYSGWVLPTVLIVYLVVLVTDNLLVRYVKSVIHWRLHLHHHGRSIPEVERPDFSASEENNTRSRVVSPVSSPTRATAEEVQEVPKSPVTAESREVKA